MKQNRSTLSRLVRHLALIGGVLTIIFVVVPSAAEAGEFPGPLKALHRLHMQVRSNVLHAVDHATRFHDGYRPEFRPRYPGQAYDPRYYRPSYRYPVVIGRVGAYRPHGYCNDRLYVNGYVGIPPVGIVFEVRPDRRVYRDAYDRYDGRGREDDRDDEDND